MGLILDIIVVVVIVLCVILSARYGFLRTLIETIGYFLSFVVASFTAKPLADLIFENAAKPFLYRIIENSLTNATDSLLQNFPTYLLTIFKIAGVDEDALSLMLSEGVRSATASLITAFEPHVVNMICSALTAMLTVLLIVVVFIELM